MNKLPQHVIINNLFITLVIAFTTFLIINNNSGITGYAVLEDTENSNSIMEDTGNPIIATDHIDRIVSEKKSSGRIEEPYTDFESMASKTNIVSEKSTINSISEVSPPKTITVCSSDCNYTTIQAAIDAANSGDTINVYPGVYDETASDRYIWNSNGTVGPYQFGLFIDKDDITIQGVDSSGNPITDADDVATEIRLHPTNAFGHSGMFVQGDDLTVTGLWYYDADPEWEKDTEVIGDGFTLKYSRSREIYINDWRFDNETNTSYVQTYDIEYNKFYYWAWVSIADGAGYSGDVNGRKILNNDFDGGAVSFSGTTPAIGWFNYPVGGAIITGNNFHDFDPGYPIYIRARGEYDNSQFDWASYFNDNTYDNAVAVGANPPSDLRADSYDVFTDRRTIGFLIQNEIDRAQDGDTVLVKEGNYGDTTIVINKSLTLRGANAGIAWDEARGSETILNASGFYVIRPSANDITLDGFKFTGSGSRLIDTINTNPNANNFHLTNCIFENPNSGVGGPYVIQFAGLNHTNMLIENNLFNVTAGSAGLLYFAGGSYDGLRILNNKFIYSSGSAGSVINIDSPPNKTNIEISGNFINGSGYAGMLLGNLVNASIFGNTVLNTPRQGIQLSNLAVNVIIRDNSIDNANYNNDSDRGGIRIYGDLFDNVRIYGNNITHSYNGFAVRNTNNITGRTIYVYHNNFDDNFGKVVYNGGIGTLNATENWWGYSNPNFTSLINGNANYDPWLCEEYPTSLVSVNGSCVFGNEVEGNVSDIVTEGVNITTIIINGTEINSSETYSGEQVVSLLSGSQPVIEFDYDFGGSPLDLSKIKIEQGTNYMIINMSQVLQSGFTKTVYIDSTGFNNLCVKDADIVSISNVSRACNGANETILNQCLHVPGTYTRNGISCTKNGTILKIENLTHTIILSPSPTNLTVCSSGCNYTTIQDAINAAADGDTIQVGAGNYTGNITINKSLTIQGSGMSNTIIQGPGKATATTNGITIDNGIDNVSIYDLGVDGFLSGIYIHNWGYIVGGIGENIVLEDVSANNNKDSGILFGGPTPLKNIRFTRVTANDNGYSSGNGRGLMMQSMDKENVIVEDGTFLRNKVSGIDINMPYAFNTTTGNYSINKGVRITGNTVSGGSGVYQATDSGIAVSQVAYDGIYENVISGNTITMYGRFGIEVRDDVGNGAESGPGSFVVKDNIITFGGGPYNGLGVAEIRDIAGIAVFKRDSSTTNSSDVVVKNNTVNGIAQNNAGSNSTGFGIVVAGEDHKVLSNTVTGCDVGVQIQQGYNVSEGTIPNGYQSDRLDDFFGRDNSVTSSAIINNNNIYGNTINMRNVGVPLSVDTTENWWGSSNPNFTAIIAGNVSYDPWLCESYPTSWESVGGICVPSNPVEGTPSEIITTGITIDTIQINGVDMNGSSYSGAQNVTLVSSSTPVIEFEYNFSDSALNLSKIEITKGTNYIIVNMSQVLQPGFKKIVYIDDNSFTKLCVKDADVASIGEVSSACTGANETNFATCIGNSSGVTISGITCKDLGTRMEISNLSYSALLGTVPSSSGGSGGGSSLPIVKASCLQKWTCSVWSKCSDDGKQSRTCTLQEDCSQTTTAPAPVRPFESQSCAKPVTASCSDNIKNQNEENVDCGGVCEPCKVEVIEQPVVEQKAPEQQETNKMDLFKAYLTSNKESIFGILMLSLILVILIGITRLVLVHKPAKKQETVLIAPAPPKMEAVVVQHKAAYLADFDKLYNRIADSLKKNKSEIYLNEYPSLIKMYQKISKSDKVHDDVKNELYSQLQELLQQIQNKIR